MIHTFSERNAITEEIEGLLSRMEDVLKHTGDSSIQIRVLKALGNAGQVHSLPVILSLLSTEYVEDRVLAVAIHATRKMDVSVRTRMKHGNGLQKLVVVFALVSFFFFEL